MDKVTYSINQYDDEGDKFDDCLLIHIDKKMILRFENIDQLIKFKTDLEICITQIKEEW